MPPKNCYEFPGHIDTEKDNICFPNLIVKSIFCQGSSLQLCTITVVENAHSLSWICTVTASKESMYKLDCNTWT